MMTKKHFEAMAEIFRNVYANKPTVDGWGSIGGNDEDAAKADGYEMAVDDLMCKFINLAKSENPRFDAERFLKACKP